MMKKLYVTPVTSVVSLYFKESCLTTLSNSVKALGNSSTEKATDYNNGDEISW